MRLVGAGRSGARFGTRWGHAAPKSNCASRSGGGNGDSEVPLSAPGQRLGSSSWSWFSSPSTRRLDCGLVSWAWRVANAELALSE